jgi:antitoxin component of MazEF toxin-antitoxin module
MADSESTTQELNSGKTKSCRQLTVGYLAGADRGGNAPHIRIAGHWVKEAGFPIGCKVNVEVSLGRLVIELAPPTAECMIAPPRRPYIAERMVMAVDLPSSNVISRAKRGGKAS